LIKVSLMKLKASDEIIKTVLWQTDSQYHT
jgi:hypothetical protein